MDSRKLITWMACALGKIKIKHFWVDGWSRNEAEIF
jgi:hypothetical protein